MGKNRQNKSMTRQSFFLTLLVPYVTAICKTFGFSLPLWARPKPKHVFDPIMISLIRRAIPNLLAHNICEVQPMSRSSGLIFALKQKREQALGKLFKS